MIKAMSILGLLGATYCAAFIGFTLITAYGMETTSLITVFAIGVAIIIVTLLISKEENKK